MTTKVQMWGSSLAVRIPKPHAENLGLRRGSQVEITVEDGQLIVRRSPSLEELVAEITLENTHEMEEWGAPRGSEVW